MAAKPLQKRGSKACREDRGAELSASTNDDGWQRAEVDDLVAQRAWLHTLERFCRPVRSELRLGPQAPHLQPPRRSTTQGVGWKEEPETAEQGVPK